MRDDTMAGVSKAEVDAYLKRQIESLLNLYPGVRAAAHGMHRELLTLRAARKLIEMRTAGRTACKWCEASLQRADRAKGG